ncbi:alpha/beta-hydrolase [Punctularia strigosozonata HHB-11173 SS5]|uniref:Alpha/beta-hydrolase n=1 Tax=Punctularia strigosozonata (strain HHB-11173) TaxID=741275 RepID=R7S4E7_PUNST|nr:alpha/beta-hydrolase [Punctularia strigosozonata HHB-11173 SS5]EIN05235.1 alpha/beta-hydrolase [Punctularia strigosozonata HHB-11173 SS5]
MLTRLLSTLTLLVGFGVAASPPSVPTVTVKNGTYTGLSLPSFRQELFLGMPYAQQPVPPGLRLRAPLSLNASWTGTRDASAYSPICVGYDVPGAEDDAGFELSEACLTINVVRPEGVEEGSDVPVVVWVYGGGFGNGGSADHRYNGTWIVQRSVEMGQPIIIVSFNYRATAFGFLWSKELAAEGVGNLGLLDQHIALRWVYENIRAFGGDPSKVTVMGESAGSISVSLQLLAYGATSTDLFRAVILESGTPTTWSYRTPEDYQPQFDAIVNATGCAGEADVVACLRAVPLEAYIAATNVTNMPPWGPTVDGSFITGSVTAAIQSGKFIKVPMLLGANLDEGTSFGPSGLNSESDVAVALATRYKHLTNDSISTILGHYPNDPSIGCPYNTGDGVLSTGLQDKRALSIWGDIYMHAGRRLLSETVSSTADVYSYHFAQVPENGTMEIGATHFEEVAYVFSNPLPTQNPLSTRPGDAELAKFMTSYWVSFIHKLDPNQNGVDGAPVWPSYRDAKKNMVFKRQGSYVEDDSYRVEGIAFYTIAFLLLGAEMAMFCIMVAPLPYGIRKRLFHFLAESPLVAKVAYGIKIAFISILVLFVDAVQRMFRITAEAEAAKSNNSAVLQNVQTETNFAARKFYAQRNVYLTGFTLFLSLVLTRTFYIILDLIHAQEEYAKLKNATASQSRDKLANGDQTKQIEDLKAKLAQQAAEYDKLATEYNKVTGAKSDKRKD